MQGVEQPPEFHPEGDVWIHTLMMLEGCSTPRPRWLWACSCTMWASLQPSRFVNAYASIGMWRLAQKWRRKSARRLRMSTRETERDRGAGEAPFALQGFSQMKRSTQLRFIRMEGFEEHLELHRLDCMSSHRNLTNYYLAQEVVGGDATGGDQACSRSCAART